MVAGALSTFASLAVFGGTALQHVLYGPETPTDLRVAAGAGGALAGAAIFCCVYGIHSRTRRSREPKPGD